MKFIISVLILAGVFWVGKLLLTEYKDIERRDGPDTPAPSVVTPSSSLSGMPPGLESVLQAAQKQGASGLANFLRQYRTMIQDPRLGEIELDYVVLISLQDPSEAKRIFHAVQQRTPLSSPVRDRIKRLEQNFQ
jgi:hypothetical protein